MDPASTASEGSETVPVRCYLSLGDSLAVGVQPSATGGRVPTDEGFADRLAASLARRIAGLRLVKLGCDGETTATMLAGGCCPYARGAQLAEATAWLDAHPGAIALVTLTLGANEVVNCERDGAVDLECLQAGFAATEANLPRILAGLHAGAGPSVPIVGANLYNPFLVRWLEGESGKAIARASAEVQARFNALLERLYAEAGVVIADVAGAFASSSFEEVVTIAGGERVPLNVARIYEWTWMGAGGPRGPDVHPNAAGYRAITGAFERAVGTLI